MIPFGSRVKITFENCKDQTCCNLKCDLFHPNEHERTQGKNDQQKDKGIARCKTHDQPEPFILKSPHIGDTKNTPDRTSEAPKDVTHR